MDTETQRILLVGILFAITLGPLTARSSMRRQPIYGGPAAQLFNLIGSSTMVAVLPSVLTGLILGGGFHYGVPVAIGFLVTTLVFMLMFGIIERPALEAHRRTQADRGWTEEDARSSGL